MRNESGGFFQYQKTFTIGNGANGSAVTPVDLGRSCAFITVECTNATGIAAATTMTMQIDRASTLGTPESLWKQDASGAWTSGTLPTSGTFTFLVPDAFGARHVRLVLSQNTTGSVSFIIRGYDQAVAQ